LTVVCVTMRDLGKNQVEVHANIMELIR